MSDLGLIAPPVLSKAWIEARSFKERLTTYKTTDLLQMWEGYKYLKSKRDLPIQEYEKFKGIEEALRGAIP